jgi:5'-nucleotidase
MRRQRIAIDMDDVMAITSEKFLKNINRLFDKNLSEKDFKGKYWLDIITIDQYKACIELVHEEGYFLDFPIMPDAVEVIKALNEKYDVFIVSAATEFPNSLKEKMIWLAEHFPFINWKNIVLCGDKSIISADYLIDDHPKNLKTFLGKSLMFDAIHNQTVTDYQRVMSWKEIATILL